MLRKFGVLCQFEQLQDVYISAGGKEYEGWVIAIRFEDINSPLYVVNAITGWEGEPNNSEPFVLEIKNVPEAALREHPYELVVSKD